MSFGALKNIKNVLNSIPKFRNDVLNRLAVQALLRERNRDEDDVEMVEKDPEYYLMPLERRNVNARYPIGRDFRNYREMAKRFPVAKRSAKAVGQTNHVTDPKVRMH